MVFATGALGTLLPKLAQLLQDEYNLHKGAKKNIELLRSELVSVHAALCVVGEVPREELSDLVKVWAQDAREVSYDMEDIVDTFLVRVQDPAELPSKKCAMKFINKMLGFLTKVKTRHDISKEIKNIKERVKEIADRRDRYQVDAITPVKTVAVDPRIKHMYTNAADLVGMDDSKENLITRLTKGDDMSTQRIVSVVGFGGLGKTTLVKAVYEKLKGQFDCTAFVPVGRNPDLKKVLKDILIELDKKYMSPDFASLDERQLINESQEFLTTKRYFLVLDDVWETESWEIIKLTFVDNNRASRIITTTRNHEVARKAGEVYKLQPLSDDYSRKLFFARIFGSESESADHQVDDEVSDKFLKKCEGIPLAIVTMATLLAGKPWEEWSEVYDSIGFAKKGNHQVENTEKIISFSYYDLPSHLRTCLLYLCVFPEDYFIAKSTLVWMWIAEGFVQEKLGMSSFGIGEGYFNELVNRSMIQLVETEDMHEMVLCGCQVHDMVLDLIRSISSEENFVTILGDNNELGGRVRRLALQNDRTLKAHVDLQLVRSFISWRWDTDKGISLSSFKLVRVLALLNSTCYSINQRHLQVPLRNLLHLRCLQLSAGSIVLPAEEMGSLKFLQTLDVGQGKSAIFNEVLITSVGLLTELLCLRIRGWINTVPDGIGKLKSLEELQIHYVGQIEPWRRFVKELCGLRELRVLHLDIPHPFTDVRVEDNMVLQFLLNLKKLEILSLTTSLYPVHADTVMWEAAGFLLPRRLRRLSLSWLCFSRFPSFCINPSRLPHLSQLSLRVDTMVEQDLRILGGLPQLRFLELVVQSIAEVVCSNIRTDDDDGWLFQNLRRCGIWYREGVRFLLPSQEDSGSVSFCMRDVEASMLLGSKREDIIICKAEGVAQTPMPSVQELWFKVYVLAFIKDGNHDNDGISLALEYFTSLQNVGVEIVCDSASSAADVEQVEAALRRAADGHPNRPTLTVLRG